MHPAASVFTAELFAIYIALQIAARYKECTVIFTDSLSSLKAIQCPQFSRHHLVYHINSLIRQLPQSKVAIEWVPSHIGIAGNEEADRVAKKV